MPAGITHVPYNDVDALRAVMDDNVACIILEPMQGEGGMYPGSAAFLGLRASYATSTMHC